MPVFSSFGSLCAVKPSAEIENHRRGGGAADIAQVKMESQHEMRVRTSAPTTAASAGVTNVGGGPDESVARGSSSGPVLGGISSTLVAPPGEVEAGVSRSAVRAAPELGGAAADTAARVSAPELPGLHVHEFSPRQPTPPASAAPASAPPVSAPLAWAQVLRQPAPPVPAWTQASAQASVKPLASPSAPPSAQASAQTSSQASSSQAPPARRRGRVGRPRKVAAPPVQHDMEPQLPRAKGLTGPMPQTPNIQGMSVVLNLAPCRPSAPHAQPVEDNFMKDSLIMILNPAPKAGRIPTPPRVDALARASPPPPRRRQKSGADTASPAPSPPPHLLKLSPAASPPLPVLAHADLTAHAGTLSDPSVLGGGNSGAAVASMDSPFPALSHAALPAHNAFDAAHAGLPAHNAFVAADAMSDAADVTVGGDGEYILRPYTPTQQLPMGEREPDELLDVSLQMRMEMDAHVIGERGCPPGGTDGDGDGTSARAAGPLGEVWGADLLAIWPGDQQGAGSADSGAVEAAEQHQLRKTDERRRARDDVLELDRDYLEQATVTEVVLPPLPGSLDPYERINAQRDSPVDMYKSLVGLHSALPARSPPANK